MGHSMEPIWGICPVKKGSTMASARKRAESVSLRSRRERRAAGESSALFTLFMLTVCAARGQRGPVRALLSGR